MSCVTFLSPSQRAALRTSAEDRATPEEIVAAHPAPPVTAGKLRRLRLLAQDENPRIRESAALNRHCPPETLAELSRDPQPGVRGCVARQPAAATEVLEALARDPEAQVRAWVAANPSAGPALLTVLADDADDEVRRVVAWARNWGD